MKEIDLSKYYVVVPVVTLLFIRDGKVLILDRGRDCSLYSGWTEMPGGQVERHELDPHQTALRESKEETGLEIVSATLLEVLTFPPDLVNNKRISTHIHLFRMEFTGNVNIRKEENEKIARARWLTKNEALNTKLVEWSRHAITRYM